MSGLSAAQAATAQAMAQVLKESFVIMCTAQGVWQVAHGERRCDASTPDQLGTAIDRVLLLDFDHLTAEMAAARQFLADAEVAVQEIGPKP